MIRARPLGWLVGRNGASALAPRLPKRVKEGPLLFEEVRKRELDPPV